MFAFNFVAEVLLRGNQIPISVGTSSGLQYAMKIHLSSILLYDEFMFKLS